MPPPSCFDSSSDSSSLNLVLDQVAALHDSAMQHMSDCNRTTSMANHLSRPASTAKSRKRPRRSWPQWASQSPMRCVCCSLALPVRRRCLLHPSSNDETIKAMKEARAGKLPQFDDWSSLLDDLHADDRTTRFKRDYRRESRGRHRNDLDERLTAIVNALARDISPPRASARPFA